MTVARSPRNYPLTLTADALNTGIVAAFDWAAEDGSTTLANGKDHRGHAHDWTHRLNGKATATLSDFVLTLP